MLLVTLVAIQANKDQRPSVELKHSYTTVTPHLRGATAGHGYESWTQPARTFAETFRFKASQAQEGVKATAGLVATELALPSSANDPATAELIEFERAQTRLQHLATMNTASASLVDKTATYYAEDSKDKYSSQKTFDRLKRMGPAIIPQLIQGLQREFQVKLLCTRLLTYFGEPSIDPLIAVIKGDSQIIGTTTRGSEANDYACRALAQIGQPAFEKVASLALSPNAKVKRSGMDILLSIIPKGTRNNISLPGALTKPLLEEMRKDRAALDYVRTNDGRPMYDVQYFARSTMKQTLALRRQSVIEALGVISPVGKETVPVLLTILQSDHSLHARMIAANSLAKIVVRHGVTPEEQHRIIEALRKIAYAPEPDLEPESGMSGKITHSALSALVAISAVENDCRVDRIYAVEHGDGRILSQALRVSMTMGVSEARRALSIARERLHDSGSVDINQPRVNQLLVLYKTIPDDLAHCLIDRLRRPAAPRRFDQEMTEPELIAEALIAMDAGNGPWRDDLVKISQSSDSACSTLAKHVLQPSPQERKNAVEFINAIIAYL